MRQIALQHGYVDIDLLPAMLGRPPRTYLPCRATRTPNALGHGLMANAIFPVLRRTGEPAKE